jgi:hypothetical protein
MISGPERGATTQVVYFEYYNHTIDLASFSSEISPQSLSAAPHGAAASVRAQPLPLAVVSAHSQSLRTSPDAAQTRADGRGPWDSTEYACAASMSRR